MKKRLDQTKKENEIIRKENTSLREEMKTLKETVKDIAKARPKTGAKTQPIQNEDQLRFVLDYQRSRLDEVEKDLETYKTKYEQILYQKQLNDSNQPIQPESVRLAKVYADSSEYVSELKSQNEMLEDKIKNITTQYAQEIALLKSRIAKQDAILISSSSAYSNDLPSTGLSYSAIVLNKNNYPISTSSSLNLRSKNSLNPLPQPSNIGKSPSQSSTVLEPMRQNSNQRSKAQKAIFDSSNDDSLFSYSKKK